MLTREFDYELPEAAIAQAPMTPRDHARLLDTRDLSDHRFRELPDLLDPGDLVVVNDTRVRAARLRGTKLDSGGKVEVLLLSRLDDDRWRALIRPARRIHPGTRLQLGELSALVLEGPHQGTVELRVEVGQGAVEEVVARVGEVPLPPYIRTALEDPELYQTVYAASVGSAAAPTAGLHFTRDVLDRLDERSIDVVAVDLEVGLDTFRPITAEAIAGHVMHTERYRVPAKAAAAVNAARRRGSRVVAIGTTVVRSLESAVGAGGVLRPSEGETGLFITPGFRFRAVDALVTNFHVPRSTLIVMIAAFMGPAWREVYRVALARGYRFLSFGDAMFAERRA